MAVAVLNIAAESTPSPLAVWTLVIAITSLLVAIASASVVLWQARTNVAELRRSKPNVRVRITYATHLRTGPGEDKRAILISISNLGKESTTLQWLTVSSEGSGRKVVLNGMHNLLEGSDSFADKIESHTVKNLMINAEDLPSDTADVFLKFGHGVDFEATVPADSNSTEARPSKAKRSRSS